MNKIYIGIVGLVVLFGVGAYMYSSTGHIESAEEHHDDDGRVESYEIYPGDVVDKIKNNEDIILLDVRTLEEYEEIHLQDAVLLPVQELSAQTLTSIGLGDNSKDKEILIYCRSGSRSKTAYDIMKSLGYTNIKSIAGGMVHWEEDEYPFTEVGEYAPTDNANNTWTAGGGASVSFDSKFYDFGEINQFGGTVEAQFTFTNKGNEVLTIDEITTSCSCTSAEVSKASLLPSESAILTVTFDPDFHGEPLGVFKRTVFIPTNDSAKPEVGVVIQVDILEGK